MCVCNGAWDYIFVVQGVSKKGNPTLACHGALNNYCVYEPNFYMVIKSNVLAVE